MPEATLHLTQLTAPQQLFAAAHRAFPGFRAAWDPSMVYLYKVDELRTYRWLVNGRGDVVDSEAFRR